MDRPHVVGYRLSPSGPDCRFMIAVMVGTGVNQSINRPLFANAITRANTGGTW